MIGAPRMALAVLGLTILAAGLGGWLGVDYGLAHNQSTTGLNQLLHHELHLTAGQRQHLAALESSFAARRAMLESQARAANRELASALMTEHKYGPKAQEAINHFYVAMRSLQVATIRHVLDMRSVLTPVQAKELDQTVARTLDSDRP